MIKKAGINISNIVKKFSVAASNINPNNKQNTNTGKVNPNSTSSTNGKSEDDSVESQIDPNSISGDIETKTPKGKETQNDKATEIEPSAEESNAKTPKETTATNSSPDKETTNNSKNNGQVSGERAPYQEEEPSIPCQLDLENQQRNKSDLYIPYNQHKTEDGNITMNPEITEEEAAMGVVKKERQEVDTPTWQLGHDVHVDIITYADGSTLECLYENGKLIRQVETKPYGDTEDMNNLGDGDTTLTKTWVFAEDGSCQETRTLNKYVEVGGMIGRLIPPARPSWMNIYYRPDGSKVNRDDPDYDDYHSNGSKYITTFT